MPDAQAVVRFDRNFRPDLSACRVIYSCFVKASTFYVRINPHSFSPDRPANVSMGDLFNQLCLRKANLGV
ncbi:MAG: hypothetical protein BGO59_33405 [Spirosoma sp. 48-14]|nr:MAG: hypothetical protein BGO59_33405 [Spirosoma sp. 48-14]